MKLHFVKNIEIAFAGKINNSAYNQAEFVNVSGDTITGDLTVQNHLSGNTAYFTSITAVSSFIDVIDIRVRELSGFDIIDGNLTVHGDITATGDITAYSDESLKTNIQVIDNAVGKVEQLHGITFDRIADGSSSTGVIAQELKAVLPEAVHTNEQGLHSVAYGNVVGLLIEAIKEQQKQIDWLMEFWQNDAERDSFNKD